MIKFLLHIALFLLCLPALHSQNELSFYLEMAKKNSPLINDNQNQAKANLLEAERLKAFYTRPQIGVTATYLFSPIINLDNNKARFEANSAGADNYLGYDFAAANGGQYQALLNVTQPLFNAQKLKIASEQVNMASQINQNNVKISTHDIEKAVTDQYILCLQDLKQNDYASSMINLLSGQKEIVKKLVESSIYKQSDLSLLNIEYQNFLFQQTSYKATYKRDLMDLKILCGITDTSFVILKDLNIGIGNTLEHSFFTEKYRLDSLSLVAAKSTFELKYKPQLNLLANAGLNAVYAPTIPNRFGVNAGLNFTYTFFDGRQRSINRNKTDVLLKSVSFYKENFADQNSLRKTKLLYEIQSYASRITIAEQQLSEYGTLLELYKKEILTGQLSIINYITVLKNMATMQRDNALLFSQKQLLINTYNYWNW